jgi:hypothetical protein
MRHPVLCGNTSWAAEAPEAAMSFTREFNSESEQLAADRRARYDTPQGSRAPAEFPPTRPAPCALRVCLNGSFWVVGGVSRIVPSSLVGSPARARSRTAWGFIVLPSTALSTLLANVLRRKSDSVRGIHEIPSHTHNRRGLPLHPLSDGSGERCSVGASHAPPHSRTCNQHFMHVGGGTCGLVTGLGWIRSRRGEPPVAAWRQPMHLCNRCIVILTWVCGFWVGAAWRPRYRSKSGWTGRRANGFRRCADHAGGGFAVSLYTAAFFTSHLGVLRLAQCQHAVCSPVGACECQTHPTTDRSTREPHRESFNPTELSRHRGPFSRHQIVATGRRSTALPSA